MRVPAVVFVLFVLCGVGAVRYYSFNSDSQSRLSTSSELAFVVPPGPLADCHSSCLDVSLSPLLASAESEEVGSDILAKDIAGPRRLEDWVQLCAKYGNATAWKTKDVLANNTVPRCALVHDSGHILLLLDKINRRGIEYLLVKHGQETPRLLVNEASSVSKSFPFAIVADDWKSSNSRPFTVGGTTIVVSPTIQSFGLVREGGKRTCTIELRNNGPDKVFIERPRTSCSCTVASLPDGRWLEAGELLAVDVEIQAGASPIFEHQVVFSFQGGDVNPSDVRAVCSIVGCVDQSAVRMSSNAVDFGTVACSEAAVRTVEVSGVFPGLSHCVRDVIVEPSWMRCKVGPAARVLGNLEETLQFTCEPPADAPAGPFVGKARILLASRPTEELFLPLSGIVRDHVALEPNPISFGNITVGETSRVSLRATDPKAKMQFLSIPDGVEVENAGSDEVNEVTLVLRGDRAGTFMAEVKVMLSVAGKSYPVTVPCVGLIISDQMTE
jgi:hypothetical protein